MTTDRQRFYMIRDRRTVEYGVVDVFDAPVTIVVGSQAAGCVRGQLATLALVNMLARIHRRLTLQIPPFPVLRPSFLGSKTLDEAAAEMARLADPYIVLNKENSFAGSAIGLGADAPMGLSWYIGASQQTAVLGRAPVAFDEASTPSLGACLAACLGASAVLRSVLGELVRPATVSAWTMTEDGDPREAPEHLGPLNVGDVLQVGAGGVGSCLDYWLREFEMRGRWCVLDGDDTELHNANRSLGIFPHHAGWPNGSPAKKALVAAESIGAESVPVWYDQFNHDVNRFDLVLPLANERNVRHLIACRGEPVLLHATTSPHWEAQFHRHLPERDDCVTCRMPQPATTVQFQCSTVPLLGNGGRSTDAALPFLSAAAGLLLLAGLFRLQEGDLLDERHNLWALSFANPRRTVRSAVHWCEVGCAATLPAATRRRIHAGRRWSAADALAHQ